MGIGIRDGERCWHFEIAVCGYQATGLRRLDMDLNGRGTNLGDQSVADTDVKGCKTAVNKRRESARVAHTNLNMVPNKGERWTDGGKRMDVIELLQTHRPE